VLQYDIKEKEVYMRVEARRLHRALVGNTDASIYDGASLYDCAIGQLLSYYGGISLEELADKFEISFDLIMDIYNGVDSIVHPVPRHDFTAAMEQVILPLLEAY
jgi:hypothetical protein